MITMSWWVYLVIIFVACFATDYFSNKYRKKVVPKNIGDLFINPEEPVDEGGVYAAFDMDPREFKNGDQVYLNVKVVRK